MNAMVDTLKGMGAVKTGIMAAVALVLIAFFAVIALRVSSPGLTSIYTNLAIEDSSKIVAELEKLGVPYEIRANGAEIMVPSDRMLRLRMNMAERGLPSGGSIVGYEIFDKSEALGSSSFVMNVNMLRALEGELARTISAFSQVESARVHLVTPKRELFTREKQEPSASVALKLRGNQQLTKSEIDSITHFVAAAVPGLKVSRVTVVDSFGRLLARGDGDNSASAMASTTEEFRVGYENRLKDTLEGLIEKIVGPGKVQVQIAADVNFDRIVTNSEKFDPEGQVARSVQSNSESDNSEEKEAAKDAVSVSNQLPNSAGTAGAGGPQNKRQGSKSDETTNYEISKTVQNHVKEGGSVSKVSVAVLVDGTYVEDAGGKRVYTPRTDEELKRIETLVRSAVGFEEKRGDTVQVINMQFTKVEEQSIEESFFDKFKHEMEGIIQTLIIATVAVLAILLVLRPAITHMVRNSAPAGGRPTEGLAALAAPAGAVRLPSAGGFSPGGGGGGGGGGEEEEEDSMINIGNVRGRVKSSSIKRIAEIVDKNPDESVNVIRQWMTKEAS